MMTLKEAARALDARLVGADATFTSVGTDTRKVSAGQLFVALIGPRFNAHTFISEAARGGAVGALVSEACAGSFPCIEVEDTRLALCRLAAHWRGQFNAPLIGVTGSNGKTTVKNLIGAMLAAHAEPHAGIVTEGNLNNDIGMPLTLLRLRAEHRFAVIEMGMNHAGEIDYLTRIARPTVALVNNAGAAHLEGLGTIENVAHAKGEIFAGLNADGIAIINADDDYADLWRRLAAPRRIVTFGIERAADVRARFTPVDDGALIELSTPVGSITMRSPLLGKHNAANVAAASAASLAAGASLADIQRGLEKLRGISGRLEVKRGLNDARVLDDTYNANPNSLAAGLEVLREARGERVLVLGDMGELGESSVDIHRRVGEMARKVGVQRVFAVGKLTEETVKTFGEGARHFVDQASLIAALAPSLHANVTVLVKGSRMMKMERVIAGIVPADTSGGAR